MSALETLKTELREFIALSKTITPGKWHERNGRIHDVSARWVGSCNSVDFLNPQNCTNAAFIARSRNISPTMAKMLLELVVALEDRELAGCPFSKRQLQQILKLWEETK
jgi:hypothetical protein